MFCSIFEQGRKWGGNFYTWEEDAGASLVGWKLFSLQVSQGPASERCAQGREDILLLGYHSVVWCSSCCTGSVLQADGSSQTTGAFLHRRYSEPSYPRSIRKAPLIGSWEILAAAEWVRLVAVFPAPSMDSAPILCHFPPDLPWSDKSRFPRGGVCDISKTQHVRVLQPVPISGT